jgi:hypothetical protein
MAGNYSLEHNYLLETQTKLQILGILLLARKDESVGWPGCERVNLLFNSLHCNRTKPRA